MYRIKKGVYMRIFLLLILSMVSYGAATDFSECKGKEANYYVAKFTKNGTANGWLKAARMHQKFYKDRGSDILVVPMLQYRRDSEGNVTDKVHRITSMVIGSQESWQEWRPCTRADLHAGLSGIEDFVRAAEYLQHSTSKESTFW